MEIIFLIFLTKNHLCSTAWSKGNLVLLVNHFQRSIVFLPCPCVSPSIDPWVTEAWNQYIHAQLELDRSWWISPSIRITDLSNDEHIYKNVQTQIYKSEQIQIQFLSQLDARVAGSGCPAGLSDSHDQLWAAEEGLCKRSSIPPAPPLQTDTS